MHVNQPTWTEERIKRLKSCFEAGLSCREIAADIGVSRNAVIGKLSRLNLTREKDENDHLGPRKRAADPLSRGTTPRRQYPVLKSVFAGPQHAADNEPIHEGHHCSLLELSEEKCRWPINTPGAEDFCFCGNRPVEGLPYCAGHSRLAYQRVARK